MIDDERPETPEGEAPEGDAPQDAEPAPSADPGEAPTAGDEPLTDVEDEGEQVSEPPEAAAETEPEAEPEATDEPQGEPDVDGPNESAPGHVDPETVKDAEPAGDEAAAEEPNESAAAPPRRERPPPEKDEPKEEVVPGAHLEPDLVLDEARQEGEVDEYADRYATDEADQPAAEGDGGEGAGEATAERAAPRTALDLAADARYQATGKRKTSVARVILKPGDGAYMVNGRSLEDYFPRAALQKAARQPLQTAGFEKRMDVQAKIHGGGISAQAGALRHGVARALVEADPALRVELKRRGFLSRDDRAKERKKAGLKKARKRPQFSKR